MRLTSYLVLSSLILSIPTLSSEFSLSELYIQEIEQSDLSNEGYSKNLADKHIVMLKVSDLMFQPFRLFRDNQKAILEVYEEALISEIETDFYGDYDSNAETLSIKLPLLHQVEQGRKLLILGNPQTGLDALYALIQNPDLIELVDKLLILQPAFGSPLVDRISSAEKEGKFKTHYSRELFKTSLESLSEQHYESLSKKTYFVRSFEKRNITYSGVFFFSMALLNSDEPSDGISYTKDQKLEGFGVDLGVVQADHWDLFVTRPSRNSSAHSRKAFTRALIRTIYEF